MKIEYSEVDNSEGIDDDVNRAIIKLQRDDIVTVFHVTPLVNLKKIARYGLKAGEGEGVSVGDRHDKIFFWNSMKKAKKFQKEIFKDVDSVILKILIPKSELFVGEGIYGKELFAKTSVSRFQIFVNDIPLPEILEYDEIRNQKGA